MKATALWATVLLAMLTGSASAQTFVYSGSTDDTQTLTDPTSLPTMLKSFSLRYHASFWESDHQIQRIAVLSDSPSPEQTFIQFRDKKADDHYDYAVHQTPLTARNAVLGRVGVTTSANNPYCRDRGHCSIPLERPSPQHVFVLRGFLMRYLSGDHELSRISVIEDNGVLALNFYDRNWDDSVQFSVEYAWLPPEAVAQHGEVTGTGPSGVSMRAPEGERLIAGFDFSLGDGYGRDLKTLTVFNQPKTIEVEFCPGLSCPAYTFRMKWVLLPRRRDIPADTGL